MTSFNKQTGSFDYQFSFRQKTGEYDWVFSLTYDEVSETLWEDPDQRQVLSGETGIAGSVAYNNGTLFLGNTGDQYVEVYESQFDDDGTLEGGFSKINRVYPYGVDGASGFGYALAALTNNVIVGAPQSTFGSDAEVGAFFQYGAVDTGLQGATGTGLWGQQFMISGTEASGSFGCALSSRIFSITPMVSVGASGEIGGSGRSYVYNGFNGDKLATISPEGDDISQFGRSQASCTIDQMGCSIIGYSQSGIGKINVYKETNQGLNDYSLFQTLSGMDDSYGVVLRGRGSRLMVGAPNDLSKGAVYFYSFDESSGIFVLQQKVVPSNLTVGDHFGKSFDFSQNNAVIGSDNNLGSAYVFDAAGSTWVESVQFSGSLSSINGSFAGSSAGSQAIVLDNNRAIIGTSGENEGYVFTTGIDNQDDYSGLALSGSQNKIYDPNGNFIYGYSDNQLCSISGSVFTGGYYTIFINKNLCVSEAPRGAGVGLTGAINDWAATGLSEAMSYYSLEIYS